MHSTKKTARSMFASLDIDQLDSVQGGKAKPPAPPQPPKWEKEAGLEGGSKIEDWEMDHGACWADPEAEIDFDDLKKF